MYGGPVVSDSEYFIQKSLMKTKSNNGVSVDEWRDIQ